MSTTRNATGWISLGLHRALEVDVPCAAIFFFPTEESMFEYKVKNEWVNE